MPIRRRLRQRTGKNTIKRLTEFNTGDTVKIIYEEVKDRDFLARLEDLGLIPEEEIKIVEKIRKGPVIIKVKKKDIVISHSVLEGIYAIKIE